MAKCLALCVSLLLASCSNTPNSEQVTFKNVPQSDLLQLTHSHFDRFVVPDPKVFSRYKQVIFFPMQFDRLTIDLSADPNLRNSWNESSWQEMDQICQHFDDFAQKIFAEREGFVPSQRGGNGVLAIEFRLMNFTPYGKRYKDNDAGTVATRSSDGGIGAVTIQAVIADSQSGELLAVIEDGMEVNAGNMLMIKGDLALQVDSNNKASQNIAWRKVFKRWLEYLHEDMRRLQLSASTRQRTQAVE